MFDIDDLSLNLRGRYAGFVTRMVAVVLDMVLIVSAVFIIVVVVRLVLTFLGITEILQAIPLVEDIQSKPVVSTLTSVVTVLLINMLFFSIYQVFFWLAAGATPGKALIGLRVVPERGQKLTFKQAVVRALTWYVSAFVFFLGFLTVLVNERRQGWHDRWANTCVLYDWDARLGRRALLRLGIERRDLRDSPGNPELQRRQQANLQKQDSKPS